MDAMTQDFRQLQRYTQLVPFDMTHLVCTCTHEEQHAAWNKGHRARPLPNRPWLSFCNTCGLYPRYMLRRCRDCNDTYVDSFDHPNKCLKHPQCWSCVNGEPWEMCQHPECQKHHQFLKPRPEDLTKRKVLKAEDIVFEDTDFFTDFDL